METEAKDAEVFSVATRGDIDADANARMSMAAVGVVAPSELSCLLDRARVWRLFWNHMVTVLRSLCKTNIHDFERHHQRGEGSKSGSQVEILTDGLFLLARRVCITSEERIERLEFVGRHTVSRAWRLSPQDDRTRHAQVWTKKRKRRLRRALTLVLVLVNKRG